MSRAAARVMQVTVYVWSYVCARACFVFCDVNFSMHVAVLEEKWLWYAKEVFKGIRKKTEKTEAVSD